MRKHNNPYRPRTPKYKKIFKGSDETFRAMWNAQGWLREHGFSYGSTDGSPYCPIQKGEYSLPQKLYNFDAEDKALLAGVMLSRDYRNGDVEIWLYDEFKEGSNEAVKFRGKRLDTGEWVFGDLLHIAGGCLICFGSDTEVLSPDIEKSCPVAVELFKDDIAVVDPDTVGQYTTLRDKNGKEIYKGDIVLYGGSIKHIIEFRYGAFGYSLYGGEFISYAGNTNFTFNPLGYSNEHEVIGNIYDNPELISKKQ